MTLLAPGAMLLAAALTIPPLVTFYLLKLRRKPLRVTSIMLWEQAAHDLQVNVPLRMIRPNWLLLLHALILALLLIAIGRPAIEHGGVTAGRVFVLLDRSASMSARDMPDGSTRLSAAKKLAKEAIAEMSRGAERPEITLIAFAAESMVLAPPSRDLRRLGALIDAIEPTDQPGRLSGALSLVRSLTSAAPGDEDEESAPPLTVIVSDGAELVGRHSPLSVTTRLALVSPELEAPPNAGFVSFAAARDVETPETVSVFVRLLNAGAMPVSAPLVVMLDGEPIVRRAVSIPAAGESPGESVETVRFESIAGGLLEVSLEHTDALDADNTVRAVLPPHKRPPTLLVVPPARSLGDAVSARDRADPFLLDVLEALGTSGLRVIDLDRYRRGDAESLASFGLIVFDRVAPDSPPAKPTLCFGAPWPGLADRGEVEPGSADRTPVLAWDRGHPVMRDAVLDSVNIADRLGLPEDDEIVGEEDISRRRRRTLARGENGPLIIDIDDAGTPRIVVAFALEQSNWPVHFSFPIFMLSAFDYLAPGSASGAWFDTDAHAIARLKHPGRMMTLEGPVGRDPVKRAINRPEGDVSESVQLGVLERAGMYTLSAGDEISRTIAVNLLDSVESSLVWISPENTRGADVTRPGGPGEHREIWRWFVLAAGVFLLAEWLVYARRARF